jgi:hypothetical protein
MVYAVAVFQITDRAAYGRYQAQFTDVMIVFGEKCSRRMSTRRFSKESSITTRWSCSLSQARWGVASHRSVRRYWLEASTFTKRKVPNTSSACSPIRKGTLRSSSDSAGTRNQLNAVAIQMLLNAGSEGRRSPPPERFCAKAQKSRLLGTSREGEVFEPLDEKSGPLSPMTR